MIAWLHEPVFVGRMIFALDLIVRLWMSARVIRRRLPAGVSWAWLSTILFLPLVGTLLYFTFGEYRQGRRRTERLQKARNTLAQLAALRRDAVVGTSAPLAKSFQALFGLASRTGNDIRLLKDADHAFTQLAHDLAHAKAYIDLEFYIWSEGGCADEFAESLCAAARRGVPCRLLVDAIGSARFLRGRTCKALRAAGVKVTVALPSGFWRSLFARPDLRIHRKIIVIDGEIAFAGSMNLADPRFFMSKSGAAPWVDALARVQGPAVADLEAVFLSDWCAETGSDFASELERVKLRDSAVGRQAAIQCLPSGPAVKYSAIEQALIMAIASAKNELVLTTPYFLPSESMLFALMAAAHRGVRTILIVPAKVDSVLTQYASRSFFEDLLNAGVQVALFKPGLLHTKSITIDREVSLFGSLNLDPRSLRINFEITLAIYDPAFTGTLVELQEEYLKNSEMYTLNTHASRDRYEMWAGDLARLVGPLL